MILDIRCRWAILPASLLLAGCFRAGAARVEPVTMAVYPSATLKTAEGRCEEKRLPEDVDVKGTASTDRRPGAIDLSCFQFPEDVTALAPAHHGKVYAQTVTAYARAVDDKDDRNRLAAILLKQSDDVCTSEKALLLKRQAEVNGWLSIATTGLSTASTIVTGELAKSILSGGAAWTSGSRDHVNTHVYRNQIIQTITKAIDTERIRLLDVMTPRFEDDETRYSVDAMIRDVNAYHQACSFGTGLQIVMESVEKRQQFDKMARLQDLDDQMRDLQDNAGRRGIVAGGTDPEVDLLRKERIRVATGVTIP